MTSRSFGELLVSSTEPSFNYIDPPFNFNAAEVACYPAEVTGFHLLESMRRRLGWATFEGRTLLDLGCGVRFARTIHNLGLPLARYVGVDVHAAAIAWLQANVTDERFRFAHMDGRNALYNPQGSVDPDALVRLALPHCDAACMFSVITHQRPEEALVTFRQLRRVLQDGAQLYFTAFIDEAAQHYAEAVPETPGMQSTYGLATLLALAEAGGWCVDAIYPKDPGPFPLQQHAIACTARGPVHEPQVRPLCAL